MQPDLQPTLANETVTLHPLRASDFPELYAVAADPEVWAQHPNKDRWQEPVFRKFFDGAMQSGGAFAIRDNATGKIIGSTRFYEYDAEDGSLFIGYTFYGRESWGQGINPAVKKLMLNYIFQFVDKVYFHIGATNFRSQTAIGRLGAEKVAEETVAYVGEAPRQNFKYEIRKSDWTAIRIEPATLRDLQALQTIGRNTFTETFSASNTPENMQRYLAENFTAEKLSAELQNPGSRFFLATSAGEVIGYLKVNTGNAQTELQDGASLEIERIYVSAAFHGKNAGQLLYEKALSVAQELGKSYIWLGVWEKNPRAIRFYEKNGFVAFDQHVFVMGDDRQLDVMMRREL